VKGTERSTYLIDEEGFIIKTYQKVKPADHAENVLQDL
jgi:peroxiredoxin Q/BCP